LLLDTNALIALTRDNAEVLRICSGFRTVSISVITLGEMEYGVAKSTRPDENRRHLSQLLAIYRLVLTDSGTARVYGEIFHQLRRKGRPIPTNDVWIAALAIQHGIPLLARDAHFRELDGLDLRSW